MSAPFCTVISFRYAGKFSDFITCGEQMVSEKRKVNSEQLHARRRRVQPWPGFGTANADALRSQARKFVPANHPPDGSPPLFAHLSGGTLRVPFLRGPAARARPPLSLRDISPALRGNLPAPPQSLRCPLRSAPCLCATGARRPLKRRAKLLCFFLIWACAMLGIFARRTAAHLFKIFRKMRQTMKSR